MTFLQNRFFSIICLTLVSTLPGCAQLPSFGVIGGVPLSDAYSDANLGDGATSSHFINRYTIGPTAEIHFPVHLSFEADLLYRHSGYSANSNIVPGGSATVNDFQVPMLAKLDLSHGLASTFIDGGVTYRHLSLNLNNPAGQLFVGVNNPDSAGVTLGGGLKFKLLLIRVSPQIRYTHWGQTAFSNAAVSSNSNQVDLPVGVTF
jgi:hypothetical protein